MMLTLKDVKIVFGLLENLLDNFFGVNTNSVALNILKDFEVSRVY